MKLFRHLSEAATVFQGAREVAAALEAQRRPSRSSLRKLGIDGDSFDSIDLAQAGR